MQAPFVVFEVILELPFYLHSIRDILSLGRLNKYLNEKIGKSEKIGMFIVRSNFPEWAEIFYNVETKTRPGFSAWMFAKTLLSCTCSDCKFASYPILTTKNLSLLQNANNDKSLWELRNQLHCKYCLIDEQSIVKGQNEQIQGATVDTLLQLYLIGEKKSKLG